MEESIIVSTSTPYSLKHTVLRQGWVNLQPYRWNSDKEELERIEKIQNLKTPLTIKTSQIFPNKLKIQVKATYSISSKSLFVVISRISRALSINVSTDEVRKIAENINLVVSSFLAAGGGRILRGTTQFEDAVKTLFTTNCSWSFTKKMVDNFIVSYGFKGSFPEVTEIQGYGESQLSKKVRCGYRAVPLNKIINHYLKSQSNSFLCDKLPGLGKYGMTHLIVLSGNFENIPIDSEVRKYCSIAYGNNSDIEIEAQFQEWGPYAFLGYKINRQASIHNWIGTMGTNPKWDKKAGHDYLL